MTNPHWSYILPISTRTEVLKKELEAAKYLVLEQCTAIEAYRLSAFTNLGGVLQYLKAREQAGYQSALVAVTRTDRTVVFPQIGTKARLEDLLRQNG